MERKMAYYYQRLSKIEQKAYYAIKEGLLSIAPSFVVPLLDGKTLSDIYFMVRMDCPEIFWSVKFSYKYYKDSDHAEMIPEYLFKKNQIADHRQAMESRIKKLARQAQGLSEEEKLLYIHDFICENVKYDKLKNYNSLYEKVIKELFIEVLENGNGVLVLQLKHDEKVMKTTTLPQVRCDCVKDIRKKHIDNQVEITFDTFDCYFDQDDNYMTVTFNFGKKKVSKKLIIKK